MTSRIAYTISISREDELGDQPWSAVAFTDEGRTVAAAAGASAYDLLLNIAKQVDKAAAEQMKADRVRDQLSRVLG